MEIVGKSLRDAIAAIESDEDKIINIIKLKGTNKRFNNLCNPYVIKSEIKGDYIKLYVSYY